METTRSLIYFDRHYSKRRRETDWSDTGTSAERDLIVEAHSAARQRRRHHVLMMRLLLLLMVFHKRGHHHRWLVVPVMLTGVGRWCGWGRDGGTSLVTAAAAIAAVAAAAAHVVAAVIAVDAVIVSAGSATAFRLLHKATPFGSSVLEPNLRKFNWIR